MPTYREKRFDRFSRNYHEFVEKILSCSALLCSVLVCATLLMGNKVAYAQEWKEILAAAKREGSLVLRGPASAQARKVLTEDFQAEFPEIRVDYSGIPGRAMVPRILAERRVGKKLWDLMMSGTSSS